MLVQVVTSHQTKVVKDTFCFLEISSQKILMRKVDRVKTGQNEDNEERLVLDAWNSHLF